MPRTSRGFTSVWVLLLVVGFLGCLADISEHEPRELVYGTPFIERAAAMYTQADSPGDATNPSYIRLQLTLSVPSPTTTQVEIVLLQAHRLDLVGYRDGTYLEYCCTDALMRDGVLGCNNLNELIIQPREGVDVMRYMVRFDPSSTTKHLNETYMVKTTGEHLFITSDCDLDHKITMQGTSEWMNPYGYLPGSIYGFIPFFKTMIAVYIISSLVWLGLIVTNWRDIITVQNYISFVIALCTVEMIVWSIDYNVLNSTGTRHVGAVVFGIIISCVRRTVSRMLIVAVSLGFGVVRPSLGKNRGKIIVVGVLYFLAEATLELVIRYGQTNEVGKNWRLIMSVGVALANAVFYWWTFSALTQTKTALESRNQVVKLELYTRFNNVLIGSLVCAFLFACYQIFVVTTNQLSTNWSQAWIFDGGMEIVLFTVILMSICFLWRPNANSRRYAYAQVTATGDDGLGGFDDDDIQLTTIKSAMPTPKFALSDSDDDSDGLSDDDNGNRVASMSAVTKLA